MISETRSETLKQHFLNHPWFWGVTLLGVFLSINVLVLTTTVLMEAKARGQELAFWEPFCWEVTSSVMILPQIVLLVTLAPRYLTPLPWLRQAVIHLLLTIPFSIVHISGMMGLRKLWYWAVGKSYHPFGDDWLYVFIYEFRKDFLSYFMILFIIMGYRMMVLRLRGEATYVPVGEQEPPPNAQPEQLLVKKLGKEFLINTQEIEWVEASGNYANLHIGAAVYPMRITMAKLQTLLPEKKFLRIHRSYIVNTVEIKHIEAQDSGDHLLTLKNGRSLNFSRRYREQFREVFEQSKG